MAGILGLPGDLIGDRSFLSPDDWKVGGRVVLPSSVKDLTLGLSCGACSDRLQLVAQVSDKSSEQRQLTFVFGCVRLGCGRQEGSWQAFTCHLGASEGTQLSLAQDQVSKKPPALPADPLQWGAESLDWGHNDAQDIASESDTATQLFGAQITSQSKSADVSQSELLPPEPILHSKAPAGSSAGGRGSSNRGNMDELLMQLKSALTIADQPSSSVLAPTKQLDLSAEPSSREAVKGAACELPEFYLHKRAVSTVNSPTKEKDLKHINELLSKYKQEEASIQVPSTHSALNMDMSAGWSGEKYEKAVVKAVEPAFFKFTKHLRRDPDQCLRLGGDLLWPSKHLPAAAGGKCKDCGDRLLFVLQLTPALMPTLQEAAQWLQQSPDEPCQTIDWDWTTIAVFAYASRCRSYTLQEAVVTIASE